MIHYIPKSSCSLILYCLFCKIHLSLCPHLVCIFPAPIISCHVTCHLDQWEPEEVPNWPITFLIPPIPADIMQIACHTQGKHSKTDRLPFTPTSTQQQLRHMENLHNPHVNQSSCLWVNRLSQREATLFQCISTCLLLTGSYKKPNQFLKMSYSLKRAAAGSAEVELQAKSDKTNFD